MPKPVTRGTSNRNDRGSTEDRRRRRSFLLETYAADRKLVRVEWSRGDVVISDFHLTVGQLREYASVLSAETVPTTRCYRCGLLLHDGTLTVDRIVMGADGGTYRRTNIRPACGPCNSSTGATSKPRKTARRSPQKTVATTT